jgi:hypothetical protein
VVVAVLAVRMVQVPIHEVIDVLAVRDRFVAAAGAVVMPLLMSAAIVFRSASIRVGRVDAQLVFLNNAAFLMMQMSIVQVVDMVVVDDSRVAAVGTVLMGVIAVMMSGHLKSP